ncbi:MAG: acyl-CoA dehydrogenase, partial [Deltaproteobacteria bacterium]|nr:acyl-CoA dehydrogenase [Deltaproteobacteria bacterium]
AGGYREALRALVPDATGIASLCATEDGGAHPRAIATRLEGGRLTGKKKWATLASHAPTLLVVASIGADGAGRNRLRVVRVAANAPGVRLVPASAAIVPEIPHAAVELDGVAVAEGDVLPGDGYDDYLKPFRTVEDIHVHAALAGYLVGVARRHAFPRETIERLLAVALAAHALAGCDPKATATHLALAGVLAEARRAVEEAEAHWRARPADAERTRWERDRALLDVAGKARAARREKAWGAAP